MPTPPKRPITTTTASYTDDPRESSSSGSATSHELLPTTSHTPLNDAYHAPHPIQYRVYKRRFLGLLELIALNIAISWCWLTYAPVSTTSAQFFDVSVSAVNWLSTTFLFAFAVATPATIYVLNKYGPKAAIVVAATLTLVGSWVRYAGVRGSVSGEGKFGVVMFGQILVGFAQPFVLSAPTRYSDVWFSEKGRIAATAVASLANPFGGALGQLINPFWCKEVDDVGKMTLYVALICTVIALPAPFIPAQPPTPPTRTSSLNTHDFTLGTLLRLVRNPSFHILAIPFGLLTTCFNAISSELNSILYPYNHTEDQAGITGAILIVVGLVAAAIASPVLDKYTTPSSKARLLLIKVLVVVVAIAYLAFVWAPQTRGVAAPYVIAAFIGAASFVLVPLALELLVEVTWEDAGPEMSSAVVWACGQVGGAVTILVMDGLRGDWGDEPKGNMKAGLVFLAVLAWLAVPLPMVLGWRGLGVAKRTLFARGDGGG